MTEYEVKVDAVAHVEADNKEEAERECLGGYWDRIEVTEAWDGEKQ